MFMQMKPGHGTKLEGLRVKPGKGVIWEVHVVQTQWLVTVMEESRKSLVYRVRENKLIQDWWWWPGHLDTEREMMRWMCCECVRMTSCEIKELSCHIMRERERARMRCMWRLYCHCHSHKGVSKNRHQTRLDRIRVSMTENIVLGDHYVIVESALSIPSSTA